MMTFVFHHHLGDKPDIVVKARTRKAAFRKAAAAGASFWVCQACDCPNWLLDSVQDAAGNDLDHLDTDFNPFE